MDYLLQNIKDRRHARPLRAPDAPRESLTSVLVSQNGLTRYLAVSESEPQEFSMRCYGVYNLPAPMRTFLTLKTTEDVKQNRRARSGTPTTPSTCNYSWSDALVVNLVRPPPGTSKSSRGPSNLVLASSTADDLLNGSSSRLNGSSSNLGGSSGASVNIGSLGNNPNRVGLFLSLVDYLTKTHIAKCVIPVEAILPGEQYNFAIVINNEGTCLYVSLSLEPNLSFQTNLFSRHPELCSLEVLLHGIQRIRPPSPDLPDPFPSNSYLAVLHFESDLRKYIKSITTDPPRLPCQQIRLDNPSAFDTMTPSAYRISPPSAPSLYPQWNCLFELTQSVADLFAPNAVLIVEVFEMNVPHESQGSIDFIAWTSIPLTELAQPGIRDGSIARHTSILHMNAPYMGVIEEPCEMASDCAPHEFSLLLEMRRWSSRYYLRQKQKIMGMGSSSVSVVDPHTSATSYLNTSNTSLAGSTPLSHSNVSLINPANRSASPQLGVVENGESRIGMGHLQHALLLHNPPPQPPPRIFIDPQHNLNGLGTNSALSPANGPQASTNPLILIDYPTDSDHVISRSSSSEGLGDDEDDVHSFEDSDESDEEDSNDSLIETETDPVYGRPRSNSRLHPTPRNLPRTGSMPTPTHDSRSAYGSGSISSRNNGLLSHSHATLTHGNDSEDDERLERGNDSADDEFMGEKHHEEMDENAAFMAASNNAHLLLDTISEATEPPLEEAFSGIDISAPKTSSSGGGPGSEPGGARRDSSEFAANSSSFSGNPPSSSSETWSASSNKNSSKRTTQRSSLPPGSSTFSVPPLTNQSSAEQLLASSHSSTSPLSPRSGGNPPTSSAHPLRVSIPTLGPFNQLGPFSAGAVPTPAPGAGYFGFASSASPLSPDMNNAPTSFNASVSTLPGLSSSASPSPTPIPTRLTPTSPPILSPGSFTAFHGAHLAHTQAPSLASSSSSNPVSDFATPTRPRRPSIVRPGSSNSNPSSLTPSSGTITSAGLNVASSATQSGSGSHGGSSSSGTHLQVGTPLSSSHANASLGTPSSSRRGLSHGLGLPEIDSPEAERNRRVLELRMAELELDTTPESPEKRVLASVLPQVRHMVMRSTTSLAKATLAEQKITSLQAENMALKRQLLKLLAARNEESSRPAPSPARPGRRSVGSKSSAIVSVSSPSNPSSSTTASVSSTNASNLLSTTTASSTSASGSGSQSGPLSASPPSSTATTKSDLESTSDVSPASTGEVSGSSATPAASHSDSLPPAPATTPSNGVITPLSTNSAKDTPSTQGYSDKTLNLPTEVPVVISDSPGSPMSTGSSLHHGNHRHHTFQHIQDCGSDSSGSIASSSSALLVSESVRVPSPVLPRAASSAAVVLSASSNHTQNSGSGVPTPSSPITSPRRLKERSYSNSPSSLPTSSSSPQLSSGSKRMTSSSPITTKPSTPTPGDMPVIEFGPAGSPTTNPPTSGSPSQTSSVANVGIALSSALATLSSNPAEKPEKPEKPPIPSRKPVPAIPSRLAASGSVTGSTPSLSGKESEIELLKEEISSWIDLSEKSAKDHHRAAELVAAKVTDDFVTHIASGIERLKNESAIASLNRMPLSPAAHSAPPHSASTNSSNSEEPYSAGSSGQSSAGLDTRLVSELKFELDKLKAELEQYQRKYLLTSAAFGEEVLLLRSKLKERKHQLQEAKKYAASLAASAASSPIHTQMHAGSAPQTPHSPHIHPSALTPHHSHLGHVTTPIHGHHSHAHPKHYIALSPISVPAQPAWMASVNAAAAHQNHPSLNPSIQTGPALTPNSNVTGISGLGSTPNVGALASAALGQNSSSITSTSAPALISYTGPSGSVSHGLAINTGLGPNTGSIGGAGNSSLGSPLNTPQQLQFSPQTSSKQPQQRRGSGGNNGLTIYLDEASSPSLSAASAPQLSASGNIIHRDIPLKSPRTATPGEPLTFQSFTSPLQSPGLAHVPPPFESQTSAPGSTKLPRS